MTLTEETRALKRAIADLEQLRQHPGETPINEKAVEADIARLRRRLEFVRYLEREGR